jgi:hypothetical protein
MDLFLLFLAGEVVLKGSADSIYESRLILAHCVLDCQLYC